MFCFSIMESLAWSFCHGVCFVNRDFVTVPATSFIDDLGPLRSVQAIFGNALKIGFDEACVLEYDLEIDERVEIEYCRDLVTVKT